MQPIYGFMIQSIWTLPIDINSNIDIISVHSQGCGRNIRELVFHTAPLVIVSRPLYTRVL